MNPLHILLQSDAPLRDLLDRNTLLTLRLCNKALAASIPVSITNQHKLACYYTYIGDLPALQQLRDAIPGTRYSNDRRAGPRVRTLYRQTAVAAYHA